MVRMEQKLDPDVSTNGGALGTPAKVGNRWIRQSIGITVSIVCLVFVFHNVSMHDFLLALEHFDWAYLVIGVASLGFGYCMRIIRWAVMLRAAGGKVSNFGCAAPFLGSIALNNVLPLRAGDIVRALVFPAALGISRVTATASLLLERLVDLLTLLICLALGMTLDRAAVMPKWLHEIATTLSLAGSVALLLIIFASPILARLLLGFSDRIAAGRLARLRPGVGVAAELAARISDMSRPRTLLMLFLLSMLVWSGELGLYVCLLGGMGFGLSASAGLILMSMATLATLVPSSPGYVGPFHLAAAAAIDMLGGSHAQAASLSILAHLSVWFPTTVAGVVAMLVSRRLFQNVRSVSRASQNQLHDSASVSEPHDHQ
ncbi:MAG: lysylphosphatidylglycerol synthase transmembrane domain-containing protein [Rhodanobacter sp.]